MSIHVHVWSGSATARITDTTDAGKRGKVCRVLRFSGAGWCQSSNETPEQVKARETTYHILGCLAALTPRDSFDYAADVLNSLCDEARADGVRESYVTVYSETIKAIHAPRLVLTAGVVGLWSASADEDGISLSALNDVNMWREITPHDQSKARAYDIAAKVWPRVQAARTLREAGDILTAAGARLHGYCGMD